MTPLEKYETALKQLERLIKDHGDAATVPIEILTEVHTTLRLLKFDILFLEEQLEYDPEWMKEYDKVLPKGSDPGIVQRVPPLKGTRHDYLY